MQAPLDLPPRKKIVVIKSKLDRNVKQARNNMQKYMKYNFTECRVYECVHTIPQNVMQSACGEMK